MEPLAVNKRAGFDYEILETLEAGLVMTGHEVKSARLGHPSIAGSHGIARGGELYITGINIPSFQLGNISADYDPLRVRKLLLTKKEILHIEEKIKMGLTLIPLKIFSNKKGFLKIQIGIAKGKKKYDKREMIKKRETERDIRREIK